MNREQNESHVEDLVLELSETEWENMLFTSNDPEITCDYLFGDKTAMVIRNTLSKQACDKLIQMSESWGYKETGYRTDYRNNLRVILRSETLAKVLLKRLRKYIPECMVIPNAEEERRWLLPFGSQGEWMLTTNNCMLRFCKYEKGGHFGPHLDGSYIKAPKERSFYTYMIYLNGDFEGGPTNFLKESQSLFKDEASGLFKGQEENITYSLKPEAGMCLVFQHPMLHEGGQVTGGLKYILRTDVLYQQTECTNPLTPQQERALLLLKEAEALERNGEALSAVEKYRAAFKLYPELESQWKQ